MKIHISGPDKAINERVRRFIQNALKLGITGEEHQHIALRGYRFEFTEEVTAPFRKTPTPAAPEASPQLEDKTGQDFGKRPRNPFSALLPLIALAAMSGGFETLDDDDTPPVLDGPPSDAMREVLEASTVLHVCPHGNAVLALPKDIGAQWHAQLVASIKADNFIAVRVMLTSAGLMK